MPGPGGHGGPGGGGGHRGGPGGGQHGGPGGMGGRPGGIGGRPGGMGGRPGMDGMGHMGHQPPPPPRRRWGWSGGHSPYGRGCCGCFLPVIGIAAVVVGALALLLF